MTWVTPEPPDSPDQPPEDRHPEEQLPEFQETPAELESPAPAPAERPPGLEAAAEDALGPDIPFPPYPVANLFDEIDFHRPPAEPPIEPLADTSPSLPVRPAGGQAVIPTWRRLVGLAMLLAAAIFTFTAGMLVFTPLGDGFSLEADQPPATSAPPTARAVSDSGGGAAPVAGPPPTLSPEQAAALLSAPPRDLNVADGPITRADSPFTIVPERPRGEVITYIVQEGDTISSIAERFGLQMDTIAWSNDRSVVFALRPGAEMAILPVDGVYHYALVPQTIQAIADKYHVDPYAIINSEFNNLFGATPQTEIPSGARVVVPGGTSDAIDWQYRPLVERTGGGGGDSSGGYISFARGEPGSCGMQPNPGGTGYFNQPLASYTWVRGFTTYHTGVDLAAEPGTAVYASSPGRVIYAGWNNWGYGRLVVLAHGPFTTLYGHLSSINVGCGQMVGPGDVLGGVGSTGDSSGPHLHFEIRYNDIPTDPLLYMGF